MRAARLAVLLVLACAVPAHASKGQFGLGLIVGQPTGVTGALEISDHTAVDGAVGLGFFNDRNFYAHLEFDYYFPTLAHGDALDLSLYIGVGGFFVAHKDAELGARAPVGLSFDFNSAPIQIFLEAAFLLGVAPDGYFEVRGAAGFRYYF